MKLQVSPTHKFSESLAYGDDASDNEFWDAVYKSYFPDMTAHMATPGNTDNQRMGIDRVIQLANGKTLYIDEKKRKEDYPDILLEYLSNDRTNAPGWVEKPMHCDYIAYAFMQSRTCYMFCFADLRRAWLKHAQEWKQLYPKIPGRNLGYVTYSIAVPIPVLQKALALARVVKIAPKPAKAEEVIEADPPTETSVKEAWPSIEADHARYLEKHGDQTRIMQDLGLLRDDTGRERWGGK